MGENSFLQPTGVPMRAISMLLVLLPTAVVAQEKMWVGKTVITKEYGVKLTQFSDNGKETYLPLTDSIAYRVDDEKGDLVKLITTKGDVGWIKKSEVLLPEQAIAHFTRQVINAPKDAGAYQKRAFVWELQGDYESALKDANETIRYAFNDMASWNSRGLLLCAVREYDAAIKDFGVAIRLAPNQGAGYCNRGFAWTQKKNYAKAIADLDKALLLDPLLTHAYTNRGLARFLNKQYDEALNDFTLADRFDPKSIHTMYYRARMLATCAEAKYRDGKQALKLAQAALKLDEHPDGDAYQTLAAAHAEVGDFAEAVRWQEKALADDYLRDDIDAQVRLKLYQKKQAYRHN